MSESYVFYKSFAETLDCLNNEQYGAFMRAVNNYALFDIEPELNGILKMLFVLIKPQIDANAKKRDFGYLGGRPETENEVRLVIVKCLKSGMTYREIAKRFDVSLGTISNLANAY